MSPAISPEPVNRFQNHSIAFNGTGVPFVWWLLRPIRISGCRETRPNKFCYTRTHTYTHVHTRTHTYTHTQTFSRLVELSRMVYDTLPFGPWIKSKFFKRFLYPSL